MSSFAYFPINNGRETLIKILPQNTSSEDAIENNTLNKNNCIYFYLILQ